MQVIAVATRTNAEWRWRIVNYAGEMVEESSAAFATIGDAVTAGSKRLQQMDVVDRSTRPRAYSSTSHLRRR